MRFTRTPEWLYDGSEGCRCRSRSQGGSLRWSLTLWDQNRTNQCAVTTEKKQRGLTSEPSMLPHTSSSHPLLPLAPSEVVEADVELIDCIVALFEAPTRLSKSTPPPDDSIPRLLPFAIVLRSSTRWASRRCCACSFSTRSLSTRITL